MTESAIAPPVPATVLANLLASSEGAPELVAYRGVLTPRELDAPARETAALLEGAALHDLGWFQRFEVRGEDRFRWLSGMVTNTVNDLASGTGAWNLVLNAQGRIQGDLEVWRDGDGLQLEIAADQVERLMAHLDRFIIMDDVELVPVASETALGLTGPGAGEVLAGLGLAALPEPMTSVRLTWNGYAIHLTRGYGALSPHYELWGDQAGAAALWTALKGAGATPVGAVTLDAFRVAEGIPVYGIDIAERDLAQETSQMRALHFSKGCYLGQEIVERIRSRGNVHRHLRQLEVTGPAPASGTELSLDGKPAGHITSAAVLQVGSASRVFALGMMRGEAEIRNQPLSYFSGEYGGTARLLATPPTFDTDRIGSSNL